ncbi:hypothetical protein Pcinc_042202 [Petrolisthes cinctipes]|uniref:Uncharacterized protein n=1 Tax=Petrolisthes cinctipes TaxID=88211 RepID=A0AAE1BLR4_PETCI|nr:hypothetical protein Pcinc_042202 [Petrolisthes cinctipes]
MEGGGEELREDGRMEGGQGGEGRMEGAEGGWKVDGGRKSNGGWREELREGGMAELNEEGRHIKGNKKITINNNKVREYEADETNAEEITK